MQIGVTGSVPSDQAKNPAYILGFSDVQRLVLDMAEGPKTRAEIEAAIAGKSFTVQDMVNVGLLRQEGSRYWLDFNLLRVSDQRAIVEAAEQLGRDLAQAFLVRRDDLERLADAHQQPGVATPALLYTVLGCFLLDWGGLAFAREQGYMEGDQCAIDGHSFTPWALEDGVEVSVKGLYWGSHSQPGGHYTFTTFGDHHSLPRFGIPDMLWNLRGAFAQYKGTPEAQHAAAGLLDAYVTGALDDIPRVMQLLRFRELSEAQLNAQLGLGTEKLHRILELLETADYVERQGELIRSRTLVLTPDDAEMVHAMLAIGNSILTRWHEQNYGAIAAQLSCLTPLQNGVPFKRVYNEVWHFVFGIANRTLVEQGFFADPYAAGRRYSGFLPAIWANGLTEIP